MELEYDPVKLQPDMNSSTEMASVTLDCEGMHNAMVLCKLYRMRVPRSAERAAPPTQRRTARSAHSRASGQSEGEDSLSWMQLEDGAYVQVPKGTRMLRRPTAKFAPTAAKRAATPGDTGVLGMGDATRSVLSRAGQSRRSRERHYWVMHVLGWRAGGKEFPPVVSLVRKSLQVRRRAACALPLPSVTGGPPRPPAHRTSSPR